MNKKWTKVDALGEKSQKPCFISVLKIPVQIEYTIGMEGDLNVWNCEAVAVWVGQGIAVIRNATATAREICQQLTVFTNFCFCTWQFSLKQKFALKENCRMKTSPGSKTQSELNNGIFFHLELFSKHHFLCFFAKRESGWPISQLSERQKLSIQQN